MVIIRRVDLKSYWDRLDIPQRKALAERCGTTFGHLRNVAYGYKPASESLAINLDRETGGQVPCETVRPDVDWAYLRSRPAVKEKRTGTS